MLRAGGNAFDAVIAAGFASAVVEPALSSLGGGGFLLARPAEGGAVLHDFFADTPGLGLSDAQREPHFLPVTVRFPGSEQVFNVGMGSAAVPGGPPATKADYWLPIRPGTDTALWLVITRLMIERKQYDATFVNRSRSRSRAFWELGLGVLRTGYKLAKGWILLSVHGLR